MTSERLIVFTRYPVAGAVKTRLIPTLGAAGAAGVHRQLTLRTIRTAAILQRTRRLELQVHFAGGDTAAMRHWLGESKAFVEQCPGTLGQRMAFAFKEAFSQGATAAIIIGTDCPELSEGVLGKAFDALRQSEVVIGPANDGGYFLIGLSCFIPEMFEKIAWGTDRVLLQTLHVLSAKGLQPVLLDPLSDIDRPEDLQGWDAMMRREERDLRRISVIIPSLNEASHISRTLEAAQRGKPHEMIVVDGGSTDGTRAIAKDAGAIVLQSSAGRSRQMNEGAARASGTTLLLLHADTVLPDGYVDVAANALAVPGVNAGAFRFRVDGNLRGKSFVEWGANLRSRWLQMPYGDQGLFLRRSLFEQLGGFADLPVMEDYEFVRRLRRGGRILTVSLAAVTSGRRWLRFGILRTTLINAFMILGYHFGVHPERLARFYRRRM
jgi:rSAM/selenodomain-associated transferase 2/rSAM/selenodomain-associated transferase 1